MMAEIILVASVAGLLYIYVGYPLLVYLASSLRVRVVHKSRYRPTVTVLIPAHNEEEHLEATIRNKLDQDYPAEQLEIVVVSDGSTDGTDEIARKFEPQGVRLIRQEPRQGKTLGLDRQRIRMESAWAWEEQALPSRT